MEINVKEDLEKRGGLKELFTQKMYRRAIIIIIGKYGFIGDLCGKLMNFRLQNYRSRVQINTDVIQRYLSVTRYIFLIIEMKTYRTKTKNANCMTDYFRNTKSPATLWEHGHYIIHADNF